MTNERKRHLPADEASGTWASRCMRLKAWMGHAKKTVVSGPGSSVSPCQDGTWRHQDRGCGADSVAGASSGKRMRLFSEFAVLRKRETLEDAGSGRTGGEERFFERYVEGALEKTGRGDCGMVAVQWGLVSGGI